MSKTLYCRNCDGEVEVSISFGITNHLGEGMPLLHFHPECFVEIAGTEYLEEMFQVTNQMLKEKEEAEKKRRRPGRR